MRNARRGAGAQGFLRGLKRGFTLVEVLVALGVMALLSTIAWQGMDGMLRAREGSGEALERAQRLATVMAQWEQDLLAVHDTGTVVPAIAFDGQTLRLTRRTDEGVQLVAWSVRSGRWQRWAGPPQTGTTALQQLWLRSLQLLGTEPGHVLLAEGVGDWQLFYFVGNAWANAQSTLDLVEPAQTGQDPPPGVPPVQREALPDGVRLVISLGDRTLTRDLALEAGR
jgi:general secretion pathway protein J